MHEARRKRPACDIEDGLRSSAPCLLGVVALRTGERLEFDPLKQELKTPSGAAKKLLAAITARRGSSPSVAREGACGARASLRCSTDGRPFIEVIGARQNNLQGMTVRVPIGAVTAVTGVAGAGKSSLAFDVLYAEGYRRYVETFSPYARQFLERLDRPARRPDRGGAALGGHRPHRPGAHLALDGRRP